VKEWLNPQRIRTKGWERGWTTRVDAQGFFGKLPERGPNGPPFRILGYDQKEGKRENGKKR